MSAPTEQEIREAILANVEADDVRGAFDDVTGYSSVFSDRLWDTDELRKSEKDRLAELWEPVYDRIEQRCREVIIREWTKAALAFAKEYPDAPRAKVEVAA